MSRRRGNVSLIDVIGRLNPFGKPPPCLLQRWAVLSACDSGEKKEADFASDYMLLATA
jgi:hypothetical protein